MLKKSKFFAIIFFLLSKISHAQVIATIPERKFVDVNEPVFVANGFFNVGAGFNNQNSAFAKRYLPDSSTKNHFNQNRAIGNDAQIYLKAGIKTQDETKYGAVVKAEYNYNSNQIYEAPNIDEAFLYRENNFGKFEFGNYKAVNQMMKVGPARFARAAGGINGKYLESVNLSMLANNSSSPVCSGGACSNIKMPQFIMLAQSPIGHGGLAQGLVSRDGDNQFNRVRFRSIKDDSFDGLEDATKLSYYTPRISGLQFGLSYAPNTQNQGLTTKPNYSTFSSLRIENVFSFGLNYAQEFDNLGLALSTTAEKGRVKDLNGDAPRSDLFAYDMAATLTYFGFSFGASYGSWGNSLQAKNGIYSCNYNPALALSWQTCAGGGTKFSDPKYYTAGIAYEIGPIGASITAIKSTFNKNNYRAISFGVDYKYRKDLMPYLEFTRFSFNANQPRASDINDQTSLTNNQRQLKDNSGFVFLTGILFSF